MTFNRKAFVDEVNATSLRAVSELCTVPTQVLMAVMRGAQPPQEYAGNIAREFPLKIVAPCVPPNVVEATSVTEQAAALDHARFVRRRMIEKNERTQSRRIRSAGSAALARIAEEKRKKEAGEDASVPIQERYEKSLLRNEVFNLMGLNGFVEVAMQCGASAKESKRFLEGWEPRGASRRRLHALLSDMLECVHDGTKIDEYRERLRDERDLDELDGEVPEKTINEAYIDRASQKPHKRKRHELKV